MGKGEGLALSAHAPDERSLRTRQTPFASCYFVALNGFDSVMLNISVQRK